MLPALSSRLQEIASISPILSLLAIPHFGTLKVRVKPTKLHFLLDPLENLHGPVKPSFLIEKELKERFGSVFASPKILNDVAEVLRSYGFDVSNLSKRFHFSGSLLTMETWLRKSELRLENASQVGVNFSQCLIANAYIYYAQGL